MAVSPLLSIAGEAVEVDRLARVRGAAAALLAFKRRDLYDTHLVALFLDATYISVRPSGPKEGVLVAWGFTEEGERVPLAVTLGMRESHEDGLCLARDLIARGLGGLLPMIAPIHMLAL
jgi:transposase-like protein